MRQGYDRTKLKQEIRKVVEKERLYRDPLLTRSMVAERIGCTEKIISEVMDSQFGLSFPIYINMVRAKKTRALLRSRSHNADTLDDLASLSGFASRKSMHFAYLNTFGTTVGNDRKIFSENIAKKYSRNMIKAVLFDLDGTLVDTEGQYTEYWGRTSRKYRPDIERLEYKIKGTTLVQILNTYFPAEAHKEIVDELYKWEAQMTYEFYPHALEFIHDLKRNGVKCAIVTSSDQAKMQNVRSAIKDFDELFDRVLTSEDFSASKPDPDCYLLGAKVFGCEKSECVIFEDAFTGLQAGMSSGIFTVGMATCNPREQIQDKCNFVLDGYEGLTYRKLEEIVSANK